jgi:hypothetical protein
VRHEVGQHCSAKCEVDKITGEPVSYLLDRWPVSVLPVQLFQ